MTARVARAVQRARYACKLKIRYVLGAGGRSPGAPVPTTARGGVLGCDCTGFVFWCLGLDRKQPTEVFPEYGGWMNTDSVIEHAKSRSWIWTTVPLAEARPGDLLMYDAGSRIGHTGILISAPAPVVALTTAKDRAAHLRAVRVIDCAASFRRRVTGYAVAERDGALWNRGDARVIRCTLGDA